MCLGCREKQSSPVGAGLIFTAMACFSKHEFKREHRTPLWYERATSQDPRKWSKNQNNRLFFVIRVTKAVDTTWINRDEMHPSQFRCRSYNLRKERTHIATSNTSRGNFAKPVAQSRNKPSGGRAVTAKQAPQSVNVYLGQTFPVSGKRRQVLETFVTAGRPRQRDLL